MMPKFHLIWGFIFSILIFFFFPSIGILGFFIIFFSSIFIDLDHAIRYSIKTRNFNPIKFWKWSIQESNERKKINPKNYKYPIFFLHGIEFVLILIILSFYLKWTLFVLIGVLFHLILDYLHLLIKKIPLFTKMSQILVLIRNKNKKDLSF